MRPAEDYVVYKKGDKKYRVSREKYMELRTLLPPVEISTEIDFDEISLRQAFLDAMVVFANRANIRYF